MHDRDATSPVIAAPAENTNIVVSRGTTQRRLPRGPKRQQTGRLDRLGRKRQLPREHLSPRRISHGRRPRLVALSRALGRPARSVAAERGHSPNALTVPAADAQLGHQAIDPGKRRRIDELSGRPSLDTWRLLITSTLHSLTLQSTLVRVPPEHGLMIDASDRMASKGSVGACQNRRV